MVPPAMETGGLSPDAIAALVTLGSVAGATGLAVMAVRRARSARRRQIEGAGEPKPELEAPEAAEPEPQAPPPPAQVIPLPPAAPALRKKDVAALAPGLARTRSGWVSRLGQLFAGRKEI